ncbi:hypothetical protein [Streptomyces purpureus]|uniref:Uncharacterized protein n=1 Tax=Streptomyces purpureus TaxID=1951 RepID=A0A918LPN2_9ACTN|nr:hypothetical protein [Streptomyces purpureus]GGT31005.1 hypothetical protein GCM10014713_25510 [Streptomyces purpureus]
MSVLRSAFLAAAVAAVSVTTTAAGAAPADRTGRTEPAVVPEADVAHHGHATLWDGRIGVWLTSRNHGPAALADLTVRLEFSQPLAPDQQPPSGCLRDGDRVLLCGTGALTADGSPRELALDLRAVGAPHEVTVRIDTVWNGGATDRDPANHRHEVLVPATGDPYIF